MVHGPLTLAAAGDGALPVRSTDRVYGADVVQTAGLRPGKKTGLHPAPLESGVAGAERGGLLRDEYSSGMGDDTWGRREGLSACHRDPCQRVLLPCGNIGVDKAQVLVKIKARNMCKHATWIFFLLVQSSS